MTKKDDSANFIVNLERKKPTGSRELRTFFVINACILESFKI